MLWEPKPDDSVCSEHFDPECFVRSKQRIRLDGNAIPNKVPANTSVCQPSASRPSLQATACAHVFKLKQALKIKRRALHNCQKQKLRLQTKVVDLTNRLSSLKLMNEELQAQLDDYKGMSFLNIRNNLFYSSFFFEYFSISN